MSGGGVGGALGAGLGMLLAPETGGLSMLIPAGLGAAGGALGAGLTGGNPLTSGLLGGAGGLAGGFLSGLLGSGADAALPAADSAEASAVDTVAPELAGDSNPLAMETAAGTPSVDAADMGAGSAGSAAADSEDAAPVGGFGKVNPMTGGMNPAAPATSGSTLGSLFSKANLPYVGLGLGALGALLPQGSNPVNVGGNASSVLATNPGFSSALPKYNYNNVQTPYSGNWYTYGQRPETPQVQNTLTPAARGGLMRRHYAMGGQVMPMRPQMMQRPMMPMQRPQMPMGRYAMGGRVRGLAMGGMPPQGLPMGAGAPPMAPQGAPPMGGPPQGMPMGAGPPQPQQNPQQQAAQYALGQKVGQMLRGHIQKQGVFSADGMVSGPGKGQDDAVPAKLSKDEFVVPADVTSMLGDGSSSAGGKELTRMIHKVRAHKATKHFPPKAKSPLAYIGKA